MNDTLPIVTPFTRRMFEQESLSRLIQEAKAGDNVAFERLVTSHQRLVLRFAYRLLLNREAARDASQEVFLRLYKNLRTINENIDLSPWLFRTASNICYDILRRTKHHQLSVDLPPDLIDHSLDPEQSAHRTEQHQQLIAALAQLSTREREVIALRDMEGYTTAEVGVILKIGEGTVRSHLSTGRVKIKNFIFARRTNR